MDVELSERAIPPLRRVAETFVRDVVPETGLVELHQLRLIGGFQTQGFRLPGSAYSIMLRDVLADAQQGLPHDHTVCVLPNEILISALPLTVRCEGSDFPDHFH